ncbi:hypothetical protein STANM309S_05011 [Streptomyces tanashiensis]
MTVRRGPQSIEDTEQSLGGEDFSWYLEHVPGAMARLGVRAPGDTRVRDLHAGDFDVDERCIEAGVEVHGRGPARRHVPALVQLQAPTASNGFARLHPGPALSHGRPSARRVASRPLSGHPVRAV